MKRFLWIPQAEALSASWTFVPRMAFGAIGHILSLKRAGPFANRILLNIPTQNSSKERQSMQGRMDCYGVSHRGLVREQNEDQFLIADLKNR